MSKRLNVLVESCGECPHATYMLWDTPVWLCFGSLKEHGKPSVLGTGTPDTIPSWCPLPDDVPLGGPRHAYGVGAGEEPEQPFPVGTVVKIDDWLNEKESLLVRSSWEIINYAPGMIFLETTGNSFYPTGYTRNYGISKFLDLNPKVVEQPQ